MSKPATKEAKSAGWRQLPRTGGDGSTPTTISQVGDGVSKVALLWFVYAMTDSALKMSLIGVLQTIPPLLGPFAGVLFDRIDKRRAMIVIDVVRTGLLSSIPILYAMGLVVFACALCAGIRDCHVLHGLRAGVERQLPLNKKRPAHAHQCRRRVP